MIISQLFKTQIEVESVKCDMEILDTAGTQQFPMRDFLPAQYQEGFVLVYSVVAPSTFDNITEYRDQVLRVKNRDDVPMILVGNKTDLVEHR